MVRVALREKSQPWLVFGFAYKIAAMGAKPTPHRLSNWAMSLIYTW